MTRSVRPLGILPKYLGGIILSALLTGATVHAASTDSKPDTDSHATPHPSAGETNAPSSATFSKTIVISSPDDAIREAKAALSSITNAPDDSEPEDKHHEARVMINVDDGDKKGGHGAMNSFVDSLIPIIGILATFGMPVLIVFVVFYFRYRRRQDNIALAREFLAKGLPVPPELLENSNSSFSRPNAPVSRSRYDIRKGILWTFIGLGISVALYVNDPHDTDWGWGMIPMIIGLGFLTAGWLDRQNGKDDNNRPASTPGASS